MKIKTDTLKFITVLYVYIVACWGVHSQELKKLTPEDYHLWSTLGHMNISDNGRWVSYAFLYKQGEDTLFAKHTQKDILYTFPSGSQGTFSPDNTRFAYIDPVKKEARWINLTTGKEHSLPGGFQYDFSGDGRFLVVKTRKDEHKALHILDFKNNNQQTIPDVAQYSLNVDSTVLAYTTEADGAYTVHVVGLNGKWNPERIIENSANRYSRLTWDTTGKHLAFLEEMQTDNKKEKNHKVHYGPRVNSHARVYTFNPLTHPGLQKGSYIPGSSRLILSEDGERIFFDVQPPKTEETKKTEKADVQVWHSHDKRTHPAKADAAWWSQSPKLSVWWPKTNKFLQIGTREQPEVILTGDSRHALTFNPEDYTPQFKYGEDYIDIHLKELSTGKSNMIIKKQPYNIYQHTIVSPGGKYIGYFKDKHWWVYNIQKDTHTNITSGLEVSVDDITFDRSGPRPPYGSPGWTKDDSDILIYDQFDIWRISPDGKTRNKLTDGRAQGIIYRIYEPVENGQHFFGFTGKCFDLKKGLTLEMWGNITKQSGYALWKNNKEIRQLAFKDKWLYGLQKSKRTDSWMYLESTYNIPPGLVYTDKDTTQLIVQGNPHYTQYPAGKSELIHYTGPNGEPLQGALFYPSDYRPGKKYPMVVHIYEKKSQELYKYITPSLEMPTGFNPVAFTSDGYFVFYPDIVYTLNNPGISALQCVTAGVNQVLETGHVNKEKIGLIGHSYGGYETSFIVSQTDMFAAAVAGAPKTDLVSSYLGFVWNDKRPSFWRFEAQQSRFLGSYYRYKKEYINNSPVHQAEGIQTPLLIWHGDKDGQVDWYQSIELYLALRRLEKESVFLVYPGEKHNFRKKENRVDLTRRTKKWFDYYLKNDERKSWMNPE